MRAVKKVGRALAQTLNITNYKYTINEKCTKINKLQILKTLPHQQPTPAKFPAKTNLFQSFGINCQLLQSLLLEALPEMGKS